jgi:hypothetical protein
MLEKFMAFESPSHLHWRAAQVLQEGCSSRRSNLHHGEGIALGEVQVRPRNDEAAFIESA